MLPSIHVLEKYSIFKNIISRCIYLCEKLKASDKHNLIDSKLRLNLFLLSMKDNANININEYNILGNEGKADAFFIKGLKEKDKSSFLISKII